MFATLVSESVRKLFQAFRLPMAFDLSLSDSADFRSMDRLRIVSRAETVGIRFHFLEDESMNRLSLKERRGTTVSSLIDSKADPAGRSRW
jgi:hypothetical protein